MSILIYHAFSFSRGKYAYMQEGRFYRKPDKFFLNLVSFLVPSLFHTMLKTLCKTILIYYFTHSLITSKAIFFVFTFSKYTFPFLYASINERK